MAKYKISRTKTGLYTTVVNLGQNADGKTVYKRVTGLSSAEVRMAADQLRDERHRKLYSAMTFEDAARKHMARKKPMVSPTTYRDYESFLRNLRERVPEFITSRIDAIDTGTVQDLLGLLRLDLSAKSVRNYWGFINSVLKSQNVELKGIVLPEKTVPDIYVPDDTTISAMLPLLSGDELEVPVLLAAFGPMRMGEIIALTMDDIDGNVVHVHRDVAYMDGGGAEIKETPKTAASNRYIQYPQSVIDKIREKGYVTRYNTKMMGYYFSKFLADNGFPHFRFHDLRHYAASTLHAQGVPDAYIMQRGGWTTDRVLKAVYRHTLADQEQKMVEKANAHFDSLLLKNYK